jgi:hypothetical protein
MCRQPIAQDFAPISRKRPDHGCIVSCRGPVFG